MLLLLLITLLIIRQYKIALAQLLRYLDFELFIFFLVVTMSI